MQTLYDIRITDRVRVLEDGDGGFLTYFDGQYIATERSGRAAVNAAKKWLKKRDEQRQEQARVDAIFAAQRQRAEDDSWLHGFAMELRIAKDDLDRLFEIFKRKLGEDQ